MLESPASVSPQQLQLSVTLGAATLLYLGYHLGIKPAVVARLFANHAATNDDLRTSVAFFRKVLGAVLFGVIPTIAIAIAWPGGLAACGLSLANAPNSLLYTLAFVAVSVPVIVTQAKRPSFREHYPEVRVPFTQRIATLNALAWVAYLIGYELFFRGVLVLGLAPLIGPIAALMLSLMAYVFVHLDRFIGETLGTLVTGTVFGLVTLHTGSILMPLVAHVIVALTSDTLASRRV